MINKERLAETFLSLITIDSISKEEKNVSTAIIDMFKPMEPEIIIDNAGEKIGGNTGNLIIKLKGSVDIAPILISGHMDTVEPGRGINPVFEDGYFKSDGTTILGSDDKSAIAIVVEVIRTLYENNLDHCPIEIVFTICEEVGLLGAKEFDTNLIKANFGYILDMGDVEGIVTKAPAANRLTLTVHGKDAHAGSCPEKGVNAISIASKAIAKLDLGRVDHETTCNIGLIKGGIATNIVPNMVKVEGEVRSHNKNKLKKVTDTIIKAFNDVVDGYQKENGLPKLDVLIEHDFPATNIPDDHPVIVLAQKAALALGRKLDPKTVGGGADSNIFFNKGIETGVLGTGMSEIHTVREYIKLDDMLYVANLLLKIITLYSNN